MKLPKELTTVTLLSKSLALVVFLVAPIAAFGLGTQYQQALDLAAKQEAALQIQTLQATPTPTPNIQIETSPSAQTAK
jgi:hypothetical protein